VHIKAGVRICGKRSCGNKGRLDELALEKGIISVEMRTELLGKKK
jgi:hypothetical protein